MHIQDVIPWIFSFAILLQAIYAIVSYVIFFRKRITHPISFSSYLGFLPLQLSIVIYAYLMHAESLVLLSLFCILLNLSIISLYYFYHKNTETNNDFIFEQIIENFPGHIYWKDKDGYFLGCNEMHAKNLGFNNRFEIIGKRNQDLVSYQTAEEVTRVDLEVFKHKQPVIAEEAGYLSAKMPLLNRDNSIFGLLGFSLDIRKYIREIEDQKTMLAEIISTMPAHVYWKDKNSVILGCNMQQAIDSGFSSPVEVIGKTLEETLRNTLPKEVKQSIIQMICSNDQEILRTGMAKVIEEPTIELDGQESMWLSHKKPLHNSQAEMIGIIGISINITERKKMEQELRLAKEEAEIANRLKSEFISNMQHDIRTPISGLKLLLSTLEGCTDLAKFQRLIPQAHLAAKELLTICNEVIDFDSIAYSGQLVVISKFSLHQLLHSIIYLNSAVALAKQLKLSLVIDDNVSDLIKSDEHRIKKILINLIGNALKFTLHGNVTLKVSQLNMKNKQIRVRFEVIDTGIGIAKHDLNKIYEKFTRLHSCESSLFQGRGMGLYVVKQYVEELKGEIEIMSELNVGSHFIVTFPIKLPSKPNLSVNP